MGIKKRNILLTLLAGAGVIALVLALVFNYILAYAAGDRHDVVSTVSSISPGVTETEYYTNNEANDDQTVVYAVNVDLSQNTLITGYKDYDTSGTWGMQRVREQAAAAEANRRVNIVAAFNGDFYNMGTGEPSGVLVMNGITVKSLASAQEKNWFAVTEDNKAYIGTGTLPENTVEAIGGATMLIKDGQINVSESDTTKNPRTAVGIKADGNVLILSANGRQEPFSSGYTYYELAEKMLELGCVDALNLDGGGSATYLAQYAGTDELVLANSPSDGQERSVSSSLFVVSNSEKTGVFGSAIVSPDNEVYTPGSTVEFSAIGADTAGFAMAIPEGASWQVAEGSAVKGEITEAIGAEGELAATFVAEDGAVGTATVEVVYEGTVYGSATIELQWPDELKMENSQFSLDFSEETDFGLSAYWQTRVVHLKEGDLLWDVGSTGKYKEQAVMEPIMNDNGTKDDPSDDYPMVDSEGNPLMKPSTDENGNVIYEPVLDEEGNPVPLVIGVMSGNIFVADAEATNVTATVTAKLANDESIMASAEVSVGVLPYVLWDFEDVTDENGNVTQTAEDYYSFGDGGRFSISTAGKGEIASAKIVDASTGMVRVGEKALQINYDFTQATKNTTLGIYFGTSEYFDMPSEFGMPTAFGVWIYVPTDGFDFWLRTWFTGHSEDGTQIPGNSFSNGFGGNYTETGQELAQGWNYISVDFTVQNGYGASYYRFGNQMFRIMLTCSNGAPNAGSYSAGYIYLDNFQFEYGPNTDDLFAPEINSVNLNSESGVALSETEVTNISDDPFYIYASYEEFLGLSDEEFAAFEEEYGESENYEVLKERYEKASMYATGVNPGNVHVYVDGNEITLGTANETYLLTSAISLPDGRHEITIEVYDNFQNLATKTYIVNVGNGKDYAAVSLDSSGEAPYLGADYLLELTADLPASIQKVTFEIKLAAGFSIEEDVAVPGFDVTQCSQTHVNNNIYTVTVERTADEIAEGSNVIAKFKIPCDVTLSEGSILIYSVVSSQITYTEGTQADVVNSFYAEGRLEVEAYYIIEADPMIVGSEGGYIYVTDAAGRVAKGVTVTVDGAPIGTTDEEGKIRTDAFVQEAGYKTVAAYSDAGYSYGQRVYGVLAGGSVDAEGNDSAEPLYVRAVATANGNTEQRIVWLSNPLAAEEKAVVKYATKADYEANSEAAFTTVEGETLFMDFTNAYAVNINQVLITGLAEGTEYVYVAGDGVTWSDVKTFSTSVFSADTNFFIIGDTQETKSEEEGAFNSAVAYCNAIINSGIDYDFALQTGDFVDNGGNYALWSNILNLFSPLSDIDFVQVFGNHEYEGSDGAYPAAMNFVPGKDYYSVTYGNVYVAVINIYSADGLNEAMDWIREDAANSNAIWKVLTLHRPPYFTNISGGSDTAHEMIPPFVDEVGFDAVFSGHDHSYARTEPMTGGQVDEENGAVYFIVGAAEPGRYGIYDDPAFNFAKTSGDYTSLYTSVHATDTTFEITVYDLQEDGSSVLFDSHTIENSCAQTNHDFTYIDGKLVCGVCHYTVLPAEYGENGYSGMAQDEDGVNYYFSNGIMQTGWVQYGPDQYYFMEDGRAADGTVKLYGTMEVPESEGCGEISFTFENGKKVGGATGWYGNWYYIDGVYQSGFIEVDGDFYYLWSSADQWYNYQLGEKVRGGNVRVTIDMGAWIDRVNLYFGDDGKLLGIVNDEDGNMIPGTFYYRESISAWMYMTFYVDENGDVQYDYYRGGDRNGGGWLYGNDVLPEIKDCTYYIQWDWLLLGDQTIGGVHYVFADEGESDPRTSENGKLLGRYYNVAFVNGDEVVSEAEVFEGETAAAPETPAAPAGNSIKSYVFAGWFAGDVQYTAELAITSEMTFEARFDVVYTEKYASLQAAAQALAAAETPAEQGAAVKAMREIYQSLTEAEIADAAAEGIDFTAYEQMLEKLYQVTFTVDGEEVLRAELYEGEAIAAPADPVKESENIVIDSYAFVGWYDGDTVLAAGAAAEKDVTYAARFEAVYTESFASVAEKLAALEAAETPADKHAAIDAAEEAVAALTAEELAAAQEVVSFELYEEMLAKVYEVSFTVEGKTVLNAELYEGETIAAPAEEPVKESDSSIASYTFSGWYDGATKYVSGMTASKDAVFAARFTMVYSGKYEALAKALNDLSNAGTPAQKREAVLAAQEAIEALTAEELADAQAEGLSLTLYYDSVAKLYEVKFTADGKTVASMTAYEGETVKAPEAPAAPAGNSVKTYAFSGWYSGETAYTQELQIAGDMTFEAVFKAEYSAEYLAMETALEAVDAVEGGTLAAQYEALSQVQALLQEFSSDERADAEAEGLSFAAYEQMLAAYNGIASGAADDMAKAESAAAKFVAAAAALSMLAAAAAVLRFGR